MAGSKPLDLRVYRKLLLDAVRRDRKRDDQIGEYKMEIRYADDTRLVTTFVATAD